MKPFILLTIDMEFSNHPEDMGIFGRINGIDYGVPMIMRLLKKYNLKATFFVDVYINKSKYRSNFIDLCRTLLKEGHDLQPGLRNGGVSLLRAGRHGAAQPRDTRHRRRCI